MTTTGIPLINTSLSVPLLDNNLTSTVEKDTGHTHNGNTVYCKTYTGTTAATDSSITLDTITGLSHIVRFYGWHTRGGDYYVFNRVQAGTGHNQILIIADYSTGLLALRHDDAYNSQSYEITVFYTK